ncbi:unnamed protein product [Pleuronectes platessa]|uniref:Uncharacterized protein n=1 Tax=Pleuronectes platessa TaxID=8262 RepID=A0A9N7VR70_PLEPL|nr:unnamed protein product [Pleuronectes platessa]
MELLDQEYLGRWDGLGSREASSRTEAMENIHLEVMRKVEAIGPITAMGPSPPALVTSLTSDLNDILAHLLMLSKRCPFEDVRERCIRLLRAVQIRWIMGDPGSNQVGQIAGLFARPWKKEEEDRGVDGGCEAVDNSNKVLQQKAGTE